MLSILDQLRPVMHANARKEKECRGLGKSERLKQCLLMLSDDTLSTEEVTRRVREAHPGVLGIRTDIIKAALRNLQKMGLVEAVDVGVWRKTTS